MGIRGVGIFVALICISAAPSAAPVRKAADGSRLPAVTYAQKPPEIKSDLSAPTLTELKRMLLVPPEKAFKGKLFSTEVSKTVLIPRMTRIEEAISSQRGTGMSGMRGAREEVKHSRHVTDNLGAEWFTWGIADADVAGFDLEQGVVSRLVLYYKSQSKAHKIASEVANLSKSRSHTSRAKVITDDLIAVTVLEENPCYRIEIGVGQREEPPSYTRQSPREPPQIHASRWSGTGFVVSEKGWVITNRHVVHGAKKLTAIFPDGSSKSLKVVMEDDVQDLALAKMDDGKYPFLKLAPKDSPNDGTDCTVIGYPLANDFGGAVKITHGIVSDGNAAGKGVIDRVTGPDVAIDAKVNPGNSGGPVLNAYGNVIAVVSMKTATERFQEAYGLAISAGRVRNFLNKNLESKSIAMSGVDKQQLSVEEVVRYCKPATVYILASN